MEEDNLQEVPFDMSKETLKSIREWIDKITQLSVGIMSGEKIGPGEMLLTKHKMVRQLIVLSSPLLVDDLEEIENFFFKIKILFDNIYDGKKWHKNIPIYNSTLDNSLDECVKGIQKSLKKYFIPTIKEGERY